MATSFFKNLKCEVCGKLFNGHFCRIRKTCSEECRIKIHEIHSGRPKGIAHTEEWREKMSKRVSGKGNPMFGVRKFGENHHHWIKDRSKLAKHQERNDYSYFEWHKSVLKRDNYKCKISNQDCNGRLEVHHVLSWKDYPELRYEINNGITLCHAHHPRRRAEEKRLSPYFMELVTESKE